MLEHAIKRGNINAQPVSVVFTLWIIKKMFRLKQDMLNSFATDCKFRRNGNHQHIF